MKQLLFILSIFISASLYAQTTSFTLTQYTSDLIRGGSGATLWNNVDDPNGTMDIPTSGSAQAPKDYYFRFSMTHFFSSTGTDSTIDWSFYRARIKEAIAARQGVRFRVMSVCNNCDVSFNNLVAYGDGSENAIPQFLHTLMQAETIKDWKSLEGDQIQWIPNWNSFQFHRWVGKLSTQIRAYNDTASYLGYNFRDAIRIVDLGYYGAYSEQHSAGIIPSNTSQYPAGTFGTAASLDTIAARQLRAFSGYKMVVPFNAFDAIWLNNTNNPVAYGQFLLDYPDSIGWIDDHLSDDQGYDHDYLEDNNRMGGNYNSKLMGRWRYSPLGGEPPGYIGSPSNLSYLPTQVSTYHLSFFGNGNYGGYTNANTTAANNARAASKAAGFQLRPSAGSMTTTLTQSANFAVNLTWTNSGLTPTYENWNVIIELRTSGGTVVQSWTSSFTPKYFYNSGVGVAYNETFALGAVATGSTYKLTVRVADPTGYRTDMPLYITNSQDADGAYILRTGITVQAGVPSSFSPSKSFRRRMF